MVHENIHGAVTKTGKYNDRFPREMLQRDHSSKEITGQRKGSMRIVVVGHGKGSKTSHSVRKTTTSGVDRPNRRLEINDTHCTHSKQAGNDSLREVRTISLLCIIITRHKLVFSGQCNLGHTFAAASHTH